MKHLPRKNFLHWSNHLAISKWYLVLCLCHFCWETGPDICGHISRHAKRYTGPGPALSTKPGARAQLTLISTSAASSTSRYNWPGSHVRETLANEILFIKNKCSDIKIFFKESQLLKIHFQQHICFTWAKKKANTMRTHARNGLCAPGRAKVRGYFSNLATRDGAVEHKVVGGVKLKWLHVILCLTWPDDCW